MEQDACWANPGLLKNYRMIFLTALRANSSVVRLGFPLFCKHPHAVSDVERKARYTAGEVNRV